MGGGNESRTRIVNEGGGKKATKWVGNSNPITTHMHTWGKRE